MKFKKKKFIKFILKNKSLKFGKFILKSGINSPYFCNISNLNKGENIEKLGYFYAKKIIKEKIKFDILFGIAYKGIPIVISTVIALKKYFNLNIYYSFNRKENKNYGETGNIIGKNINNKRILILDDVLTAGTAIKESYKIIKQYKNVKVKKIIVALNREENRKLNLHNKIISLVKISEIIKFLKKKNNYIKKKNLKKLIKYYQKNVKKI